MMAGAILLVALNSQVMLPAADAITPPSTNHPIQSQRKAQTDRPFDGPLAPGLQVSGGSRLKRARNQLQKAARRMRASAKEQLRLRSNTGAEQEQQQQQQQQQEQVPPPQPQHPTQVISSLSTVTSTSSNTIDVTSAIPQPVVIPIQPPRPPITEEPQAPQPPQGQSQSQQGDGISKKAIFFMSLLAIQFGIQPVLVRNFTPRGICKSSVVMTQELVKGVIALGAFYGSTCPQMRRFELSRLSIRSWLTMAGVPAAIYVVQNLSSLLAYQNLEALTFNVLNQTKTLSAALCCYLVMGRKQSKVQSFSLIMLLFSALVIEEVVSFGNIVSLLGGGIAIPKGRRFTHGVIPCLFASFLSGLAGALTQKNLQGVTKAPAAEDGSKPKPINPYLFSMELTVASMLVLVTSLLFSDDGRQMSQNGFFYMWTPKTMIPILTNSFGGILVGLVTKYAGSVRKGFALIFGILLSGFLQAGSHGISVTQVVGGMLAAMSLWMHSHYSPSNMPKALLVKKES
jgi:UDP-sugar transporter A1/2/3